MKNIYFALFATFFLSTISEANTGWKVCNVIQVSIEDDNSGEGIVKFDCTFNQLSGCSNPGAETQFMSFDPSTYSGRSLHSLSMLALSLGTKVKVIGNSCFAGVPKINTMTVCKGDC